MTDLTAPTPTTDPTLRFPARAAMIGHLVGGLVADAPALTPAEFSAEMQAITLIACTPSPPQPAMSSEEATFDLTSEARMT